MTYIIIAFVCFCSSIAGSICGIGGGVIIKPVLDAAGLMDVTTISFLSGCTVLSMSVVSVYKNIKNKQIVQFDKALATILALGAVIGGILGKSIFQTIIKNLTDQNRIGAIQALVLLIVTTATVVYTLLKDRIKTYRVNHKSVIFVIGMFLGMMSAFLGIGGGPINLFFLSFFFSMEMKQAAAYSLYIIMFSQISSIVSSVIGNHVPAFEPILIILMSACGILGGLAGSRINRNIDNKIVDRLFIILMILIVGINIFNIIRCI